MYLSLDIVRKAISELRDVHPFYGITYLVCKLEKLPIGRSVNFGINKAETDFLNEYYKPDFKSIYYFQPLRTSNPANRWLSPKYASSGSQSTRTRGQLAAAFIHTTNSDLWGWERNYVRVLREKLDRDKKGRIPAFWLAVWLMREKNWPSSADVTIIAKTFLDTFLITNEERRELFSTTIPELQGKVFVADAFSDENLLRFIESAPDAAPEEGGTLKHLALSGVGPSKHLEFRPAERLSVITGDNGLGKTFLLECAWWSLTGQWAERKQAYPRTDVAKSEPAITFTIAGQKGFEQKTTIHFDFADQAWPAPGNRPTIPGLTLYARVDGSFAVFDPVRHGRPGGDVGRGSQLVFSRSEVLDGLPGRIEGLLRDWVKWQHAPDQSVFESFKAVLKRLSPPDMQLIPDSPVRLWDDAREIPTLRHAYDVVPFTNESAGVKRIVTMAYLLAWAWNEHKIGSSMAKKAPQKRMVILVDEMEAHLHPKWQRVVLPAILDVTNILGKELEAQLIVATHSPLILASLEQDFSESRDKLFHLQLANSTDVSFGEVPFIRHGRVDAWLTSELFELKQPTSQETENALERAKRIIAQENPDPEEIRAVSEQLNRTLPPEDSFWPRWFHFAKQKGVTI
ncbi:MAG: AAA family ATPase [Terriglobales bacterium]